MNELIASYQQIFNVRWCLGTEIRRIIPAAPDHGPGLRATRNSDVRAGLKPAPTRYPLPRV
jgi:hypothetical protein